MEFVEFELPIRSAAEFAEFEFCGADRPCDSALVGIPLAAVQQACFVQLVLLVATREFIPYTARRTR